MTQMKSVPVFSAKPGTFFLHVCKERPFRKEVKKFYFQKGTYIQNKSDERKENLKRIQHNSNIGRAVNKFNNTFNLIHTVVEMRFAQ